MSIVVRTLLAMMLSWIPTAQGALFKIQQTPLGEDRVQIAVLVDDLAKLKAYCELSSGADLIFAELSAGIALGGAWVTAPADPASFTVPRQTDFKNLSQFDDGSEKSLAFEALVKASDMRRLNANDPVFSFTVKRPASPGGTLALKYINLGAGTVPLPEDVVARLAELGESNGLLAGADVTPAVVSGDADNGDVPIPLAAQALLAIALAVMSSRARRRGD